MSLVGDMVVQQANSPGTGNCNLIAVAGRSTLVSQNGAGQVFYFMQDGASWEKGIGTVTAGSPDTLSRDTVLGNSLGTTARINFAGAVTIECDIPAERALWASAAGDTWLGSNRRFATLAPGTAVDDAIRMDQVTLVGTGVYSSQNSSAPIVVALPATTDVLRLDLRAVVPQSQASMFMRVSVDGGQSFLQGANEYTSFFLFGVSGSAPSTYPVTTSYAQLTPSLPYFPATGYIEIDPTGRLIEARVNSAGSLSFFTGNWTTVAAPTHVAVGFIGAGVQSGQIKVSRRYYP